MSAGKSADKQDFYFLFKAWISWLISAVLLLLIFSFVLAKSSCSSRHMAYLCSLLSLLASVAAGSAAARTSRLPPFLTGLLCGFSTVLLLLLLGLILDRKSLDSNSVLSLVSFTMAGNLIGTVFSRRNRIKHRSIRSKPSKRLRNN